MGAEPFAADSPKFDETQPNVQLDFKKNIFFQMDRVNMLLSAANPNAYYAVEALEAVVSSWKALCPEYLAALKEPEAELKKGEVEVEKIQFGVTYDRTDKLNRCRLDFALKKYRLLCRYIIQPALPGDDEEGYADASEVIPDGA